MVCGITVAFIHTVTVYLEVVQFYLTLCLLAHIFHTYSELYKQEKLFYLHVFNSTDFNLLNAILFLEVPYMQNSNCSNRTRSLLEKS